MRLLATALSIFGMTASWASPVPPPSEPFSAICVGEIEKTTTGHYFLVGSSNQYGSECGSLEIRQAHLPKVLAVCPRMSQCRIQGTIINLSHGLFEWHHIDAVTLVADEGSNSAKNEAHDLGDQSPNAAFDLPRRYFFKLTWHGTEEYPIIDGVTNLPDGVTVEMMILRPKLPDWQSRGARGLIGCVGGSCEPAILRDSEHNEYTLRAKVKEGRFSIGPISLGHAPLYSGTYSILVYVPVGRLAS